jgi:hypothetical protein
LVRKNTSGGKGRSVEVTRSAVEAAGDVAEDVMKLGYEMGGRPCVVEVQGRVGGKPCGTSSLKTVRTLGGKPCG